MAELWVTCLFEHKFLPEGLKIRNFPSWLVKNKWVRGFIYDVVKLIGLNDTEKENQISSHLQTNFLETLAVSL